MDTEKIERIDTSKTHKRACCNGHIYITVARDKDNKFDYLLISPPAKTNDCGGSWASAVQDLLTFALKRSEGEKDLKLILKSVSGHYCNAMRPNKDHCKSCADAISSVLREELK